MLKTLLISTLRDEGPFILDWIAHHRAAGVSDFLLFSNDCTDGTDNLLNSLHQHGVISHVENQVEPGRAPQWQALKAAWDHPLRKKADWILGIDCDEYLNLKAPLATLADLYAACDPGTEAITLPWRFFGHNNHVAFEDQPVSAQFTMAAPMQCSYPLVASYFKTVFRTNGPFRQLGVHRPKQKKSDRFALANWCDGSGAPLPARFAKNDSQIALYNHGAADLVQLNHYSVRSAESFIVKRARGLPNHTQRQIDLNYWVERNFNSEEDLSIAHMAAGAAAEKAKLLELPGLKDLHDTCVAHHRRLFKAEMQNSDTVKLFGRLLMAPNSQVLSRDQAKLALGYFRASL